MGGENVKITILQRLLQMIAPDLCYFCGKIGASFCEYCKYDITYDSLSVCFRCNAPSPVGVCAKHDTYITQVIMIGSYEDGLKKALEGLKFCNDRFVSEPLAELLAIRAPFFPTDAVVTPIPTLRASIRRRGYDQAFLLARAFARRRGLEMRRLVERSGSFVQHDTESRLQRERQVRGSFTIKANTSIPETVILIDDIITTGATVNEVAKVLRQAGVVRVYVMAIAHPI